MSIQAETTDIRQRIAEIIAGYRAWTKQEWWLLDPGDPMYEEPAIFDDGSDGTSPEGVFMVRYYNENGERVSARWADEKPAKLKRFDFSHFKQTPNELLIGRNGLLLVSEGRYRRREKPEGGYEYLPIDEYYAWRKVVALTEPRTLENKPWWAESARPIPQWNIVDYVTERGDMKITQRLEHDGTMRDLHGGGYVHFNNGDDLREIARNALELADLLEAPQQRTVRRSAEVEDVLREREQ